MTCVTQVIRQLQSSQEAGQRQHEEERAAQASTIAALQV